MQASWLEMVAVAAVVVGVAYYERRIGQLEAEVERLRAEMDNAYGSARLALDKIAAIEAGDAGHRRT